MSHVVILGNFLGGNVLVGNLFGGYDRLHLLLCCTIAKAETYEGIQRLYMNLSLCVYRIYPIQEDPWSRSFDLSRAQVWFKSCLLKQTKLSLAIVSLYVSPDLHMFTYKQQYYHDIQIVQIKGGLFWVA